MLQIVRAFEAFKRDSSQPVPDVLPVKAALTPLDEQRWRVSLDR